LIIRKEEGGAKTTPKLAVLAIVVFAVVVIATAVPAINKTITDWLKIIFH
jgi:pyruvate/2-oxoglutarate dehydrogenase complex dihydrolipoamide acyltransferase (E2) component